MKHHGMLFVFILLSLSFTRVQPGHTVDLGYQDSMQLNNIAIDAFTPPVIHDGIISANEYSQQVVINAASNFNMYYTINQSTIYVAMEADALGWIALGFGSTNKMQGSDLIIGYVDSFGITYISDNWGTSPTGHAVDSTTQDILSYGGSESNGHTVIEFSRYLDTNDPTRDNVIPIGSMTVLWAYSDIDDLTSYHSSRGTTSINFQNSSPSVPRSVSLYPGDQYIYLDWLVSLSDGGSTITGYVVKRSLTSGGPYTLLSSVSQPNYNDTGLSNNQAYYYIVIAQNAIGDSLPSNEIVGYPSIDLSPPLNLHTLNSSNQVEIAWDVPQSDGGSPISHYNIYRSEIIDGSYTLIGSSATLNYLDTNIINGITYYYKVTGVNDFKEGQASSILTVTPIGVSLAPNNVLAQPAANNITLSWSAPTIDGGLVIQNYTIYRSTLQYGTYTVVGTNTSALGFIDLSVVSLETYYYKITAFNSAGESTFSGILKIKAAQVPYSVDTLSSSPGYNSIILQWSAPFDNGFSITNYNIYRAEQQEGPYFLLTTTSGLTYEDISVTNGDIVYYKISAVNNQGEGGLSTSTLSIPGTEPSSPHDFSGYPSNRRITLIWYSPTQTGGFSVSTYNLYRKSISENSFYLIYSNNSLSYVDNNVTNGENYSYRITAINQMGESNSSEVNNLIPSIPPSKPLNIELSYSNGNINMSWSPPETEPLYPVIGYKIYRTFNTSLSYTLLGQNTTNSGYIDTSVVLGSKLYYSVTAFNIIGESIFSDTISIFPASVPLPIQNLVAIAADQRVSLLWSEPISNGGVPILGYQVYRTDKDSNFENFELVANTSETHYHDLSVSNNKEYRYYVIVANEIGFSIPSNIVSGIPIQVDGGTDNIFNVQKSDGVEIDQAFYTLSLIVSSVLIFSTFRFLKKSRTLPGDLSMAAYERTVRRGRQTRRTTTRNNSSNRTRED